MTNLIESEHVESKKSVDVFILMVRYGQNFWASLSTHPDIESATLKAQSVNQENGQEAWRIVAVRGLPVRIPPGEVDTTTSNE